MGAAGLFVIMAMTDGQWPRAIEPVSTSDAVDITRCTSSVGFVETTRPYDFFGARASEAGNSLRQRLLVINDHEGRQRRFTGQTDWHIEWRPCYEAVQNGCRIGGVVSQVHVTYTLPRWADRASAPPGLRDRWDRYIAGLTAHEKGHGAVAVEVARHIERELVGLHDNESCNAVSLRAAAKVEAVMQRGEDMQRAYDRMTGHGSDQGAVFPF